MDKPVCASQLAIVNFKETVEVKNTADSLVYAAEKAVRDAGDKIPADTTGEINAKIEELKKVKDGGDTEAIKRATSDLSIVIQKIGEIMNKQEPQAPAEEEKKEGEGNVKEAEYEEKKKEEDK